MTCKIGSKEMKKEKKKRKKAKGEKVRWPVWPAFVLREKKMRGRDSP
jgi:hypothetical protein